MLVPLKDLLQSWQEMRLKDVEFQLVCFWKAVSDELRKRSMFRSSELLAFYDSSNETT